MTMVPVVRGPACLLLLIAVLGCSDEQAVPSRAFPTRPARVAVAAAADLQFAFDEVARVFERAHADIRVHVTYGSSGNFYAQLVQRAPFDIYFSADTAYPRKLIEQDLAVADSEFVYALGQLVIWVRSDSPIDVEKLGSDALLDPAAEQVAMANPRHAPYGWAAEAAMRHSGVYERVKSRLVLGENIAQTAHFVASGAADVGILSLSLASAPLLKEKGRYWRIPVDAYPTIEQASVILKWAKDRRATEQLRAFVMSSEGRSILERHGFRLPGEG